MKIAIMADIHGNLPALKATIEDIDKNGISEIYSLGDQIGLFPYLDRTLDLLDSRNVTCIKGNFEELDKNHSEDRLENWYKSQIGNRDFDSLPRILNISREGINIIMSHKKEWTECPKGGLHLFGHTHESFLCREIDRFTLNPGAVSAPVGFYKNPEAHYAILELCNGVIQTAHKSIGYSANSIWQDFIDSGCYDVNPYTSRIIIEMLYTGESNALFGQFFKYAKNILHAEGKGQDSLPDYPHDIWEKTSKIFPWRLANGFDKCNRTNLLVS